MQKRKLGKSSGEISTLGLGCMGMSWFAKIAQRKKATPAQIARAWLLVQKPWIVPILGTTNLHRLEENIEATAVELRPDDLREIESAATEITVQGGSIP